MPQKPTVDKRFWSKVTKTTTCWLWTGGKRERGTGLFKLDGKRRAAHRLVFELVYGQLQGHTVVFQKCGIRACVRPDHLGSRPQRNRLEDRTASLEPTGSCIHGQQFTLNSLFVEPSDGQGCSECIALYPPTYQSATSLAIPERVGDEGQSS